LKLFSISIDGGSLISESSFYKLSFIIAAFNLVVICGTVGQFSGLSSQHSKKIVKLFR